MGNAYAAFAHPEIQPGPRDEPTFDPSFGFQHQRKERVMIATQAEMESAKIPLEDRDYCAHLLLDYRSCRADVFPFVYKCAHEKHTYLNCEYEDYLMRLKEYEREKRLRIRQQKLNKKNIE